MSAVNAARLLADLQDLAQIGRTPQGGVSRPALSEADVQARAWFRARAQQAGFTCHQDGAGSLSAVWPAADPSARTLLLGSHLDSVPDGGRYDGALGVLAGLEVMRTLQEAGSRLPFHLETISFTDEEGGILGLFGSRAAAGLLTPEDLHQAGARAGASVLEQGLARLGLTPESALAARRGDLLAYLELHIEQGTRLEENSLNIGVVTAIVGIRSYWLRFRGEAAHAGTMPMPQRRDAFWGAADFALRARSLVMELFAPGVVNCGSINLLPGAFNIVPGQVDLALEFRHGSERDLDRMEAALLDLAESAAQEYGLALESVPAGFHRPAPMDETLMAVLESAADSLGLTHTRLMSFAGHDAQSISHIAPAAMLFVPSVGGISHNPRELTRDEDVANGANVLLRAVLALAQRAP